MIPANRGGGPHQSIHYRPSGRPFWLWLAGKRRRVRQLAFDAGGSAMLTPLLDVQARRAFRGPIPSWSNVEQSVGSPVPSSSESGKVFPGFANHADSTCSADDLNALSPLSRTAFRYLNPIHRFGTASAASRQSLSLLIRWSDFSISGRVAALQSAHGAHCYSPSCVARIAQE